ncbi:MAG: anti-sigma factor family protein [Acidimicrobiales bacterium]
MSTLSCGQARDLVSDYIDRELDSTIAADLERHLASCLSCPPLYASLVATLADLTLLDSPVVEVDSLVERVLSVLNVIGHPRDAEEQEKRAR